jgi:hypothetical protein
VTHAESRFAVPTAGGGSAGRSHHMAATAAALCAVLATLAALVFTSSASAASTHVFDKEFETGCASNVTDLTVDYVNNYIYTTCPFSFGNTIERFDLNGNPAPFSASEPYISGNKLLYNPAPNAREYFSQRRMAVDNSGGPNTGRLVVTGVSAQLNGGQIVEFEPSGELASVKVFDSAEPEAVEVDDEGNVYGFRFTAVRKFDTFLTEKEILFEVQEQALYGRVDSHGGLWILDQGGRIRKYEPDAWSARTDLFGFGKTQTDLEEAGIQVPARKSPFAPDPAIPQNASNSAFEVDPTDDDLLVVRNGVRIEQYTRGTAEDPAHMNTPAFGTLSGSNAIGVDDDSNVYVKTGTNKIVKLKKGPVVPDVRTFAAAGDDIGHEDATLRGRIEPVGGGAITSCKLVYGSTQEAVEKETGSVASCTPDPTGSTTNVEVSAKAIGLTVGQKYFYRFAGSNANGSGLGAIQSFTTVAVLKVKTLPATAIDLDGATLNGSFDPDASATEYWYRYGLSTSYGNETGKTTVPGTSGVVSAPKAVEGLPSGKTFHYQIVATKVGGGTTFGQDLTFRTASPPEISGTRATDLTGTTAKLNARLDSVGFDTTYRFEYGQTPSYGQSVPEPDGSIPAGTGAQDVFAPIAGLNPGVTYHFRLVATNQWGTTESPDATFDFEPPSCPNSHIRQQTRSSYLPDCRAYELVSPGDAGSVNLYPTEAWRDISVEGRFLWPQNSGLAVGPPRFQYYGAQGAAPGTDPSNAYFDQYLATRTPTGWVTQIPGLKGSEALLVGRRDCSDSLDVCIDHNEPEGGRQVAANLWSFDGARLGTLPSNIESAPGAEFENNAPRSDEQISGDGSTYAFSRNNFAFAEGGLTTAPGSVYVNDIQSGTVELISLKPGTSEPIPQDVSNSTEFIRLPGISTDGSHVLMSLQGSDGPNHLYMRVGGGAGGTTYDVTKGHGVTFLGMTRDGSQVVFSTPFKLSPGDTDEGTDIYRWSENPGDPGGPTWTVLTQGNGKGNVNGCTPIGYGSGCSAVPLSTEQGHAFGIISAPSIDDFIAKDSADVFFYSPELLDADRPGIPNQRNLYQYHDGEVELVATLEPGTQISRIQISPDGRFAGLLTAASLTGYDAHGKREMYTWDADSETIRCASCRPDGLPPKANVVASQSGPFMSDDGRVFFATREAIVPRDVDGEIMDVYEFIDGRPQLISSGTGSRDSTEGSELLNLLEIPKAGKTGLEAVSADGNDVYFSTYDTLVPQDENGPFIKFYDARTGGGFESEPEFAGCEAADECHNPGSTPPAPPVIGTGLDLGSTGNVQPAARKKKKKKRAHRRKHTKRHSRATRSGSGHRG